MLQEKIASNTLTRKLTPIVLGIGIPASIRSISVYLQQIIDTMFIGHYDTDSLAAISSVVIPFWTLESVWIGTMSATTIMIAQRVGAKLNLSAAKTAQMTFIYGFLLSFVYFWFWRAYSGRLAEVMGLTGYAAEDAVTYINMVSYVYLFRFAGIGSPISVMEALGHTRIIMIATIIQTVLNTILDPLFIWGVEGFIPEMGIKGAALVTVIVESVACIILSIYFWRQNYLKLKNIPILPLKLGLAERAVVSMPITVEIMVWSFSTSMIISMMNRAFPSGGVIFNVGFLLSDICYRMLYGFDVANMSLMGRSFGAKRKDRMKSLLRAVARTKWASGIVILTLMFVFRHDVVGMFTNDKVIINTTLDNFIWIMFISFLTIPLGVNFSTLNSMGYSRYCLYVSLVAIPLRVALAYFFLNYTEFGVLGVWLATVVEEGVRIVWTTSIRDRMLHKYWRKWDNEKKAAHEESKLTHG